MLARRATQCLHNSSRVAIRRTSFPMRPRRCASGATSGSHATATAHVPQSSASLLGTLTSELDKISPRFEIQPEQIEIIQSPAQFYETLKVSLLAQWWQYRGTGVVKLGRIN